MHLKAPGNWINDPNGFIYYKGKYHLFFQYFPYAPYWGTMHWGHAVSEDLVNWEHVGIALYPSKDFDRNGVFSGSALDIDGKMHLFYTGVVYDETDPENIHVSKDGRILQNQVVITSLDGMHFDNIKDKRLIITKDMEAAVADPYDCRDPKVWKEGKDYFLCLGSTENHEKGALLIFKSSNAEDWTFFTKVVSEKLGTILECPDMFKTGNQWVLVSSPCGIYKGADYAENQAVIRKMEFDDKTGEITLADRFQFFDYGMDLYAPQSTLDKDGVRTIIAWARMAEAKTSATNPEAGGKDWNGMMCIPRTVGMVDGEIVTAPHKNVKIFFDKFESILQADGKTYVRNSGVCRQIVTDLQEGEAVETDGVVITLKKGILEVDRSSRMPRGGHTHSLSKTPYIGGKCHLEIYDEPDMIEVFVNHGKYVITNIKY